MKTTKKYPTPRLIYDRKKKSSKNHTGTVEVEILFEGKRKWISTGVRILPNEWKGENGVSGRTDALVLNAKIQKLFVGIISVH